MLSEALFIAAWVVIGKTPKVPADWFRSTTNQFEFCLQSKFEHPLCPPIYQPNGIDERNHPDFQIKAPSGNLNADNLFRAVSLYQIKRPPVKWLEDLRLNERKPVGVDAKLWNEAQYLYGKVLFDLKRFKEAEALFDQVVELAKGRGLYHQERAWVLFFNGKWDRSLGSMVSAESPLIHPVPFFEKYFLRALIQRDTCFWNQAFDTIAKGRKLLKAVKISDEVEHHPWVILCDRNQLGQTCRSLREFYISYYEAKVRRSLSDLDLLEIEMRDRGQLKQTEPSTSDIVWPYIGENWRDELGYYSVPVKSKCG